MNFAITNVEKKVKIARFRKLQGIIDGFPRLMAFLAADAPVVELEADMLLRVDEVVLGPLAVSI